MEREIFCSNPVLHQVEQKLISLSHNPVWICSPEKVFDCLSYLYETGASIVLIDNSGKVNQIVLLNSSFDTFYLGIEADGSIVSRGVFPSAKNRGNDHAIFCWPVMIGYSGQTDPLFR